LIPWAGLHLDQSGVDAASGKKWLELTVSDEGAKKLEAFTSAPEGRSVAMVSGGQVASHHKIREALKTSKVKISCCDARACERLLKLF
jgi:preprotein translocase subunit SecD